MKTRRFIDTHNVVHLSEGVNVFSYMLCEDQATIPPDELTPTRKRPTCLSCVAEEQRIRTR